MLLTLGEWQVYLAGHLCDNNGGSPELEVVVEECSWSPQGACWELWRQVMVDCAGSALCGKKQFSTRSATKERTRQNWAQTAQNKTVWCHLTEFCFRSLPFVFRRRDRWQWGAHPFRRGFVVLLVFWGAVQCQINHVNLLVVVLGWSPFLILTLCSRQIYRRYREVTQSSMTTL